MMALITSLIPWEWLAGAVMALGALLAAWGVVRRGASVKAENKGLKEYQKTRERMDNAEDNLGADPDLARRWLRERGKQ